MKTVRALRTTLDTSPGGYGRVEANTALELPDELADRLVKEGQFEFLNISPKAIFVSDKVEDTYEVKVEPELDNKVITPVKTKGRKPSKKD